MNETCKISVTELMNIFRGAMLSIIPWLEKAKIPWKDGQAYDDWDNILDALYKNIVCSSLIGEVSVASEYAIARYNFHYDNYSKVDFILIKSEEYDNVELAFVAFASELSPFDGIKVAVIKDNSVVEYLVLPQKGIEFIYVKNATSTKEFISEIDILL